MRISDNNVRRLESGEHYDNLVPGLVLWVGKRRRSWFVRSRVGGKYVRVPLGGYPDVSIADARKRARSVLVGDTPPRTKVVINTLGDILDRYEVIRRQEGNKIKTLDERMKTVRHDFRDHLSRPIRDISRSDVRSIRDSYAERGKLISGNRSLAYAGPVFNWALEEDLIDFSPIVGVRRAAEKDRDRVLEREELSSIWNAALSFNTPTGHVYGRLVRFLMLIPARKGEVAGIHHEHIVDDIWQQADNKSNRPHLLPLPSSARSLIEPGSGLVFTNAKGGTIQGWSKLKRKLDEASGVTDWRLHDLRRTVASGMQALNIPTDHIQAVLNHQVGVGAGPVYLRDQMLEQKRAALETWSHTLAEELGLH